jgi:hypothetical protein
MSTVKHLMGRSHKSWTSGKPMYGASKVSKVMGEYGKGKLRSGSKKGPVVKNRKQAVAIALNEARKGKK